MKIPPNKSDTKIAEAQPRAAKDGASKDQRGPFVVNGTFIGYSLSKRDGFVKLEDGEELFLTTSALAEDTFGRLNKGDKITVLVDYGKFANNVVQVVDKEGHKPGDDNKNSTIFDMFSKKNDKDDVDEWTSDLIKSMMRSNLDLDQNLLDQNLRAAFRATQANVCLPEQMIVHAEYKDGMDPGLFLDLVIKSAGLFVPAIARDRGTTKGHLYRIIGGHISISAEMALKLDGLSNISAMQWLYVQSRHDLRQAQSRVANSTNYQRIPQP